MDIGQALERCRAKCRSAAFQFKDRAVRATRRTGTVNRPWLSSSANGRCPPRMIGARPSFVGPGDRTTRHSPGPQRSFPVAAKQPISFPRVPLEDLTAPTMRASHGSAPRDIRLASSSSTRSWRYSIVCPCSSLPNRSRDSLGPLWRSSRSARPKSRLLAMEKANSSPNPVLRASVAVPPSTRNRQWLPAARFSTYKPGDQRRTLEMPAFAGL